MRTLVEKVQLVTKNLFLYVIMYMPGVLGIRLRRFYFSKKFLKCGSNLTIGIGVSIDGCELIRVGDNVVIDSYCIIATSKELQGDIRNKVNDFDLVSNGIIDIGNDVHIVQFCILMGHGGIVIKDNCTLSSSTKVYSMTNLAYDPNDKSRVTSIMPYHQALFLVSQVVLDRNVWLGLNTVVMPGVHIGENSFSVTNSVIVNSFCANSYIAGNLAERQKDRFTL